MNPKPLHQTALNLLSHRDHSQHELMQKLKAKSYPLEEIEILLENFIQTGLINDMRFTENYIHWRRNKGYGPQRISIELQTRGIAEEMIAEQLKITDNVWLDDARKIWHKHFKGKLPQNFKERAKQMRFLYSRGFTSEQIEEVMKE